MRGRAKGGADLSEHRNVGQTRVNKQSEFLVRRNQGQRQGHEPRKRARVSREVCRGGVYWAAEIEAQARSSCPTFCMGCGKSREIFR